MILNCICLALIPLVWYHGICLDLKSAVKQAIKHGAAKYTVDETGKVKYTWCGSIKLPFDQGF